MSIESPRTVPNAAEQQPIRYETVEELVAYEIAHNPGSFAVVAIDLDGLKDVNDSPEGHQGGNEFIETARVVLQASVRLKPEPEPGEERRHERHADHIVAVGDSFHPHGDEFFVVLSDVSEQAQVDRVIERLRENLDEYGVEASMGGCVHQVDQTIGQILGEADTALRDDKMQRAYDQFEQLPDGEKAEVFATVEVLNEGLETLQRLLGRTAVAERMSLRSLEKFLKALEWHEAKEAVQNEQS